MTIKFTDCAINPVAKKVLAEVKRILRDSKVNGEIFAHLYVNGRERGFQLDSGIHAVSFAEDRRSDNIVVYTGARDQFAYSSGIPDDIAYENAVYFSGTQVKKAATFIAKYLVSSLKPASVDMKER